MRLSSRFRSLEHLAKFDRQLTRRERFGKKFDAGVESALMNDRIARIAARKQHFQIGSLQPRPVCQLSSVDPAWKPDVSEQQVDTRFPFEDLQCAPSVGSFQYLIAQFTKHCGGIGPNGVVIFNYEDYFLCSCCRNGRLACLINAL